MSKPYGSISIISKPFWQAERRVLKVPPLLPLKTAMTREERLTMYSFLRCIQPGDEGDLVAGSEDTVIAGLIAGVPAFVLALAGDGGLERDIGEVEAQVDDGLGEKGVAAEGHAAYKVPEARLIDGAHGVGDVVFEPEAARVALIAAPGQFGTAVPGEAAGYLPVSHMLTPLA